MSSPTAPDNPLLRYRSAEVSRGLIFDFGLPTLWRRVVGRIRRSHDAKRIRKQASG